MRNVWSRKRASLVDGMQWFQNTYTRHFNVKHKLWGPLFGGRYKAVLIQSDGGDYVSTLIDYVHLNPVRAGMIKQGQGFDESPWTSLREYRKPPTKRQPWIATSSGFEAVGLEDNSWGRKVYITRLENLIDWSQPSDSGKILWQGQSLQSTLKRGWYFGAQEFRKKLLARLETGKANLERKTARRYTSGELKAYDEQVAETIVCAGLKELGLERSELADLPKNAPAKALLAHIITEQTSVPQKWISQTLHMGSAPYVSKLAKEMKQAIPRSKKWRDVKQSMMRFIT